MSLLSPCLRGAVADGTDTSGRVAIRCQSGQGRTGHVVADLVATTRSAWLREPTCLACHHDGKREGSSGD